MTAICEGLQQLFNTMVVPALLAGGGTIITLICKYSKRFFKNLEVKHELDKVAKTTELKNNILKEIESTVQTVVGSNMGVADDYKSRSSDGKLTDEQSKQLKINAKELILASLPDSITKDDGVLLEVIGGKERLNIIISSMIDKAVYDYNLKKKTKSA